MTRNPRLDRVPPEPPDRELLEEPVSLLEVELEYVEELDPESDGTDLDRAFRERRARAIDLT